MTQQTLEQLLQDRVSIFTTSDRPREIIDEHVEKMFQSVISDAFRSYGDMGKAVSEAIKGAMPGNVESMMDLSRYNSLISNAIKEQWEASSVTSDMARRAKEAVDEALQDLVVPETVSLRKLLEVFAADHAEEAMQNGWECPRVTIEEECGHTCTFVHIYFDKDPGETSYHTRSKYGLENSLAVRCDNRPSPYEGGRLVGEVYAAKVDCDVMGRKMGVWRNDWEKLMVALYYGGAKLVIDCYEDDISYPGYD